MVTEIAVIHSLLQLGGRGNVIDCSILHVVVLHMNGEVDSWNFMLILRTTVCRKKHKQIIYKLLDLLNRNCLLTASL